MARTSAQAESGNAGPPPGGSVRVEAEIQSGSRKESADGPEDDGPLRLPAGTNDAPPVFDALIAANGRLYLTMKNGTVACWEKR